MAKGKKGKTAKQAKGGGDVEDSVPSTAPTLRRLQPCSEEIRVSFNFIQRFIKEMEKDAPCIPKQGATIPCDDVVRAQQLCAGLLEQNESVNVDSEADPLNPQFTALNELARAKRERADALLKADEVGALRKIVSTFPRNITISYESVGRGQKDYCLRLMTTAEQKAVLKGPEPVIQSVGYVKLMANAAKRDGIGSAELDEALKDPKSFGTDLNKFIERFTPSTMATTESHSGLVLRVPLDERKLDSYFFEKGDPLQKPVVDKEAMMTEDEWQYEAKTLKNTLLHHRDVVERFAENAFKFIPGFNARIETKELFEHILLGIEELSIKKDDLITKNKDLHSAIEKKSYNKSIIEEFCAGTMQWFPHLQTKYECVPASGINEVLVLISDGISDMATARDRALNLNVPLRAQIAELKKNLVTEAEALKSSQDGRDQDRAKHMQKLAKKEGEITGLLHQAKKTASDSDQFKKSQQKKAEQLMADLSATQSALALKTTELESTVFDADRVQSELEQVCEQSKQLDTGRAEREAVVANLRKQLEEAKSRLLSSRTNQQVEEDRIRKAVQGATATRDERIKVLEKELQDLKNEKSVSEQVRKSDEKNIRELFQDKYALKEKNDELEEKFANVAAVHEALEQEIAEGQAKIKLLEDQLSSSRAAIERDSNLA